MKLKYIKILIITFFINSTPALASSFNQQAIIESIKASCATNKNLYEKCFGLNENGCNELLMQVIPKCSQNTISLTDQNSILNFSNCLTKNFQEKLSAKGLNMDAPCSR